MAGVSPAGVVVPTPPPALQAKDQLPQAVAVNAVRMRAIGERLRAHFRGGATGLSSPDFAHLLYAFARGIDYALSGGDLPKVASEIPDILRKVYQLRKDPLLQSSVMVLVISCKNACSNNWFQTQDSTDILRMADELSGTFCTPHSSPANNTVLETISAVMVRYYPKMKFERLVISLEAKAGYDILMADFFIHRNLPREEKLNLIVIQKENLDASTCITTPPHVSFLVNGKGVDKRTNVSMEPGAQFPTDITKMLKYGANMMQAVGHFNANYIIAIAFMSNLSSFDAPKLDDHVQPVITDPTDTDTLEEGASRVSLKCPISISRIKTPIKGRRCKHFQCFDYDNYLEMNLRKPNWRCPCCNTPSNFIDLCIDQKMAKVLQETGDDVIDVLLFPDGSWKVVSVQEEKSDEHASGINQENMDIVEPDETPDNVIDLTDDDNGDLPMSSSASEDMKPLLNNQDVSVADYLPDLPISTTAQPENLFGGGEDNGCSNITLTSGQNSSLPSAGPGSSSFGTLESILPRNILCPVITDAVSPSLETSNSTFAMQHVLQGTHPDIVQLQSSIDSLHGPEAARPSIPRNVRREPVAVQALAVPPQNPGLSRRAQPNLLNCPPPTPQSSSASSTYQAHQLNNADTVITSMNSGVRPLPRASDATSLIHLHATQQDMRNISNHLLGRATPPHLMGSRPPSGGLGQARGAHGYGTPPMQQQQQFDKLLANVMSQHTQVRPPAAEIPLAIPIQPGSSIISLDIHSHPLSMQRNIGLRPPAVTSQVAIPLARQRMPSASQSPAAVTISPLHLRNSMMSSSPSSAAVTPTAAPHLRNIMMSSSPSAAVTPTAVPYLRNSMLSSSPSSAAVASITPLQVGTPDDLVEPPVDPNWQPSGRMRGSLTGSAYNEALERYLHTPGQQPSQARPSGTDAHK